MNTFLTLGFALFLAKIFTAGGAIYLYVSAFKLEFWFLKEKFIFQHPGHYKYNQVAKMINDNFTNGYLDFRMAVQKRALSQLIFAIILYAIFIILIMP